MPRYFFDFTVNGTTERDEDGVDFSDVEAARLEAHKAAGEIAAEPHGPDRDVIIRLRGEGGDYMCEISLSITTREIH